MHKGGRGRKSGMKGKSKALRIAMGRFGKRK